MTTFGAVPGVAHPYASAANGPATTTVRYQYVAASQPQHPGVSGVVPAQAPPASEDAASAAAKRPKWVNKLLFLRWEFMNTLARAVRACAVNALAFTFVRVQSHPLVSEV